MLFFNPEKQLKKKVNDLDKEAFLAAYDKYSQDVYRYVYYRVSSREITEDILSQVFLNSWKYLTEGRKIDNVRAFFYRTAHNLLVNYYKDKEKEHESINEEIEETIGENSHTVDELEENFNIQLVKNCLDDLPIDEREIVRWRFIDELSIDEISEITGKSKNYIYVIVHRSLKKLQGIVKKYSVNSL